jgi:hypothetical protein
MNKTILILVLVIFLRPGQTFGAEDYTGRWYVSVSGQKYVMDLAQQGHKIQGLLYPQNKNKRHIAMVYGTTDGRSIDILTSNKDLSIVFHFQGALVGKTKEQALVGHYTINKRHLNRWYALRYDRKSYWGSADSGYSVIHNFDTPPNLF